MAILWPPGKCRLNHCDFQSWLCASPQQPRLGVAGLTVVAAAQTLPAAPAIARTVVAGTKLPSLGDTPLYFRVVSVSIPPDQNISLPASNGILYQLLYQLSGSTEVSAGEAKTITSGGGVLIADGTTAALTAGNGEQSTRSFSY